MSEEEVLAQVQNQFSFLSRTYLREMYCFDQVKVLIFAGYETTSSAYPVSYFSYQMANFNA